MHIRTVLCIFIRTFDSPFRGVKKMTAPPSFTLTRHFKESKTPFFIVNMHNISSLLL